MFAAALAYFLIVSRLVIDMDIFSYRYKEILPPGENQSLLSLLQVFFTNPLYILIQGFTAEKMKLIALLILPLLLLPLAGFSL